MSDYADGNFMLNRRLYDELEKPMIDASDNIDIDINNGDHIQLDIM